MGYYDNHVTRPETRQSRGRSKGSKTAISGFLGAVLGAVVILFSLPYIADNGWLPFGLTGADEEILQESDDGEGLSPEDIEETSSIQLETTSEVIEAVNQVSDAVVGVVNMQENTGFMSPGGEGTGSGVVYKVTDEFAYIVTNQHVIEGASAGQSDIDVTLSDGARVEAELVGEDILTDLAVLTIGADKVDTVANFGDSDQLQAGEPAIAIGNPLSFEGTVTLGIISAVDRSLPVDLTGNGQTDWNAEVLQTDAAINPGNSGGALLNIQGEVIGINSMKIAQNAVEGIGFAIPTSVVLPVIEDLEEHGEVQRPQMGIVLRSLQEIPSSYWQDTLGLPEDFAGGVYIENVEPGSPADEAGLRERDVIKMLDDEEIKDANDLRRYLYTEVEIGDTMSITYFRDGEEQTTELILEGQVF
ncbi:S1C family serine protease [Salisediminibacterium beveridgei]|uniref:Serine protease, DegP/HtrA n=1 Tax=Salisediminibacterium beveridgei TaxID=632773 RepID=A0A1D7QR18_9BACI|nr:trypsin-like peptidase domain-containing protein [Salisediminibacterium beveridgei]AOM81436.1 Serine protease, DegP/HtrA [Salisediminibacterium beveridgei]